MRHIRLLAAALLLVALPACIFSPKPEPDPPPPAGAPSNDTPENAIKRFLYVYAQKDAVEFERLLTGNYTFEFSNAADPSLVQKFSTGWFKEDEKISSTNLFQGGVNQDGVFQPAALSIAVTLGSNAPADDNGAGRDPNYYKVLYTTVDVTIEVPGDLTYVIGQGTPQFNRFFLVRGDFAEGLTAEQPADSVHWYLWNWRDESPDIGKATGSGELTTEQQASTSERHVTWGELKALTR